MSPARCPVPARSHRPAAAGRPRHDPKVHRPSSQTVISRQRPPGNHGRSDRDSGLLPSNRRARRRQPQRWARGPEQGGRRQPTLNLRIRCNNVDAGPGRVRPAELGDDIPSQPDVPMSRDVPPVRSIRILAETARAAARRRSPRHAARHAVAADSAAAIQPQLRCTGRPAARWPAGPPSRGVISRGRHVSDMKSLTNLVFAAPAAGISDERVMGRLARHPRAGFVPAASAVACRHGAVSHRRGGSW